MSYLTVYLVIIYVIVTGTNGLEINTSNGIIQFDPYVSTLDEYNLSRYSIEEIIPLVTLVATRFSRFYIEFPHLYLRKDTSLRLTPLAIARYNCLPTTKNKIEVYLGVIDINCQCENLTSLQNLLATIAHQANQECNETVTTILLKTYKADRCKAYAKHCPPMKNSSLAYNSHNTSLLDFKWGMIISFENYCNEKNYLFKDIHLDYVILKYSVPDKGRKDELKDLLYRDLSQCRYHTENNVPNATILKKFSVSDTGFDKVINLKYAVDTWTKVLSFTDFTYVIYKAFDTPFHFTFSGWWYLANDDGTTNTSSFIFEEKITTAAKVDHEENPESFQWLYKKTNFDKNSTGIIVTGNVEANILANDFCRSLAMFDWYTVRKLNQSIPKFILENKCGLGRHLIIFKRDLAKQALQVLPNAVKENAIIMVHITVKSTSIKYNQQYVDLLKQHGFHFGYYIDARKYNPFAQMNVPTKNKLLGIFSDPNSVIYLFLFEETKRCSQLGATRMFRRRVVFFEQFKRMVLNNREHSVEIGFAIQRYYLGLSFYESPLHMQNYVKYITSLNEWSAMQNNVVVYVALDIDENIKEMSAGVYPSVGWYSFDINSQTYRTKRQQALELSISTYEKPSRLSLSGHQIVGVVLASLVLCIGIMLLSVYILKRYYKEHSFTKDEIYQFLKGGKDDRSNLDLHNVPYDKEKYEISEDSFAIDEGEALGSGEFGKVYRGTIVKNNGDVDVAIKTTNPLKFHKTTLKGMLSEIKVLAYLEKHENIIELIGANTSKLKDGKVYIFLELCHLGSLETCLRDMILGAGSSTMENSSSEILAEINKIGMDNCISQDLYRWSTDICNGMAYLAEKHVVHADLATRNVLLNLKKEAKICDFGLSRRMYNYTNYVKSGQEPLPWKWMAPESLSCMEFSEKSDVWAYGVTLWEIYSFGASPYPGLAWDTNFPQKLKNGLRSPEPEYSEQDMYNLMKSCWNTEANQRPSFSQIQSWLRKQGRLESDGYSVVLPV